jgi:hypothetical protein
MGKAKAKTKTKRKVVKVDFDDEDSVRSAMAEALGCDVGDVEISEDKGLGSFGKDTVYEVQCGHEYKVVRSEDEMEDLAIAVVTQDLEQEPELFDKDFISGHIDTDHLRKELWSDVYNSKFDDLKEESSRRPLKFMEDNSIDVPSPSESEMRKYADAMSDEERSADKIYGELKDMSPEDQWSEMGEDPEVTDKMLEEVAESETNAVLKDPMDYLNDIYGDEASEKAIEIAGIDIAAAAKEAVSTDGAAHFLCRYDGNYHTGPGGIVYWRDN